MGDHIHAPGEWRIEYMYMYMENNRTMAVHKGHLLKVELVPRRYQEVGEGTKVNRSATGAKAPSRAPGLAPMNMPLADVAVMDVNSAPAGASTANSPVLAS
jgi:hypothetical protein